MLPSRATAVCAFAGAIAAAYLPSLGASFQFDDWNVIVGDSRVQSFAAWWQSMPGMRALLKLSYAFNHESAPVAIRLLGSPVAGFRFLNILLHLINVVLVFLLCQRLGAALEPQRLGRSIPAAAIAAGIFALHPMQTEVVTYISGRSCSFVALLCFASLLLWLRHLERPARAASYWGAMAAGVLALTCKETAVILPAVMVLWSRVLRREQWRTVAREVWPFAAVMLGAAAAGLLYLPYLRLFAESNAGASLGTNLLSQAHGVTYLLGHLLLLEPPNPDPMLAAHTMLDFETAARSALLLGLLALGLFSVRRAPAVAFGILWFFAWLAPTNSLVPRVDVANDRQLYIAMVGPAWVLGWGVSAASGNAWRIANFAAVISLGVVLAAKTYSHNRIYATEISFWQDVRQKSPLNARAANNLGMAYALACQRQHAIESLAQAARLAPTYSQPLVNLRLLRSNELPGMPHHCR